MAEPSKTRKSVDLDDLERQLRHAASEQPRVAAGDPLAELARIVGQDDPFKAIFAPRRDADTGRSPDESGLAEAPARAGRGAAGGAVGTRDPVSAARAGHARAPDPQADGGPAGFDDLLSGLVTAGEARPRVQEAVSIDRDQDASAAADDAIDRLLRSELQINAAAPLDGEASAEPIDPFEAELAREAAAFRPAHEGDWRHEEASAVSGAGRTGAAGAGRQAEMFAPEPPASEVNETLAAQADYPEPPEEAMEDLRSLEPQAPRKGLVIAGVLLGVAVIGVGAVVGLRGFLGGARTSEPPVIAAQPGPIKIAPENPGGVEIPNQNKQIYERGAEPSADSRVVTREEQPIDVRAATRPVARVILPGPGTAQDAPQPAQPSPQPSAAAPAEGATAANEAPPASLAPVLGEPRRVRTVSVRPDGSIVAVDGTPVAAPAAPPTGGQVAAAPAVSPPAPAPAASAPAAPAASAAAEAAPVSVRAPLPPVRGAETPIRPALPATPPAQRPAQPAAPPPARVAALPPAPAQRPAPVQAPAAAPAGGGFMIQLAAPGSEAEARATFASLQRRFPAQLGGASPVVRRAEVSGGRTVYRLRIGPLGREEATQRCEALKAAGGQCFIARN